MNQECGVLPAAPASAVPVLPPTLTPWIAAGFAYAVSTLNTIISFIVPAVREDTAWAKPAAIAGMKVGGKTGTAESGAAGSTPHSWFIGYAPADDPRVAIAVIMEHKGSGTDFATPAARTVLQRALEVYRR